MMDRGRFDDLVDSIEIRYADRPAALASRTWLWLLLGYAVVILLTGLLVGGGLAIFVAGIFWPGVGIILVIVGGVLMTLGLGRQVLWFLSTHSNLRGDSCAMKKRRSCIS